MTAPTTTSPSRSSPTRVVWRVEDDGDTYDFPDTPEGLEHARELLGRRKDNEDSDARLLRVTTVRIAAEAIEKLSS